jgi:fructose-1,6-bisphosphatase/inositol monophosphatase family enzyme
VVALKPIIEEAGGRYSNWDGGTSIDKPDVVVSNGKLHDGALAVLRGKP